MTWDDFAALLDLTNRFNAKQDVLDVPSQAEAEAGTATTPRAWTAERITQAIASKSVGLGIGQTYQDVTAARTKGTSYQNSNKKPILVLVVTTIPEAYNKFGVIEVSSDGAIWQRLYGSYAPDYAEDIELYVNNFIIPPNNYYRLVDVGSGVGTVSIKKWMELR